MSRALTVIALALAGLVCATGIGAAAYYVSRDSVGLPVTKLQPRGLAPAPVQPRPRPTTSTETTTVTTPVPTTTGSDDHGGGGARGRGGRGGDD
jgi:hypothetical protein